MDTNWIKRHYNNCFPTASAAVYPLASGTYLSYQHRMSHKSHLPRRKVPAQFPRLHIF